MPEDYNTPWMRQFLESQAAQLTEDKKYPQGHNLREVTVIASGRPEDRMKANLQSSIERRQQKDAKDRYTLQRNMNQAQEGAAHNLMPLVIGAASPLGVLGWTAGSTAAHDAASRISPTAEKIVSGAELGLMALGAGVAGGRALLNNTNWGRAYQLSRAIGKGDIRETPNFGNNELFRATVYRGGPIRNPRAMWVTTDPKYAAQYGTVRKYQFATKNPSYAELPLIGSRDPVSLDMMIDMYTKNNPQAQAIIGHDLITGEFPHTSEGLEILSLNPYQFRGFRPKPRYVYPWQQPSRSTLTAAERAGIPKGQRNFRQKRHVANYPGYQLKGLMKGSPLERQLSKNGTININQLNAYFNKASEIEREVANKVLAEKFAGQKTINYNQFKKAVQDELIGSYNRVPQTEWADYGMDGLGLAWNRRQRYEQLIKDKPEILQYWEYNPNTLQFTVKTGPNKGLVADPELFYRDYFKSIQPRLNTFTFESPRIPYGNTKHYGGNPLGHSRTYILSEDPHTLYVMESQSDWAQQALRKRGSIDAQSAYERALQAATKHQQEIKQMKANLEKGLAPDGHKIQYEWERRDIEEIIKNTEKQLASNNARAARFGAILHPEKYVQENHLKQNYLQRQLQENLRYAAENGQTRMRYPTPETVAKIEGYTKTEYTPEYQNALDELNRLSVRDGELAPVPDEINLFNDETIYYTPEKRAQLLREVENRIAELEIAQKDRTYPSQHQTILKKYADFPKLFQKLYKDQKVRIVTDAKGNTWYEVDVPKGYLSREWQFKNGGVIPSIIAGTKNPRRQ